MTELKDIHDIADRLPECEIVKAYVEVLAILARHEPALFSYRKVLENYRDEAFDKRCEIAAAYAALTRNGEKATKEKLNQRLGW